MCGRNTVVAHVCLHHIHDCDSLRDKVQTDMNFMLDVPAPRL